MKIYVTSIFVDDQDKAEKFYTETLGFKVKHNISLGENRWVTVVSKEDPEGTELLLEPSDHPAVGPYKAALVAFKSEIYKCTFVRWLPYVLLQKIGPLFLKK